MSTKILYYALIVILIAGCGGSPATEAATEAPPTIAPSATSQPTATPIPPSPTPEPPRVTGITIDGNADDWANYPVNLTDPTGDQLAGMADLTEARYLMNDQSLYLFVRLENDEAWDDMAFVLGFEGGKGGQLNIRPNKHVDVGIFGENSRDLAVLMEIGDVVEVKIPLDQFPAGLERIDIISVYNHGRHGNDPVDESLNGVMRLLSRVEELEPTPMPGAQPEPNPTRFELTAEDGLPLVGYYYPSWQTNAPLILLVHQYGLNQEKWLEYGMVDWLQNWPPTGAAQGLFPAMPVDQSFAVLTVDLRGFGESGPPIPSSLTDEQAVAYGQGWITQVQAVLAYAETLPGVDSSRIAIVAANNGADASVAACGDCLGVLALSPGNYFYLDFKASVEALDAQGKIVWCFSTSQSEGADVATCASVSGTHYYTENFPGNGRGMQLIRDDKAPEGIGLKILKYLQLVFGFPPN